MQDAAAQNGTCPAAVSKFPERSDFFDMLVDTVIIPDTKESPPVVATEADKFGTLIMAPALSMTALIGFAFTGNWIGPKMGWIKGGPQSNPVEK